MASGTRKRQKGNNNGTQSIALLEQERSVLEQKLSSLVSQILASLHDEDGDYEVVKKPSTTKDDKGQAKIEAAPIEEFSTTLKQVCRTYDDQIEILESEILRLRQRDTGIKDQLHSVLVSISNEEITESVSTGLATKYASTPQITTSNTLEEIQQTRSDLATLRSSMESLLAGDRKEMVKFFFRLDSKLDEQTARSKAIAKQDDIAQQDLVDLLTTQHHELIKAQQRVLWTVQNRRRTSRFWIVVRWIFRLFFYAGLLALIIYFGLIWDDSVNAFICAPAVPGTRLTAETGLLTPPFWLPHNSTLKNTVFRVLCTNVPRVKLQVRNQQLIVWRKKPYNIKKRSRSKVKTYPAKVAYVAQDMIYMADMDGWHTEIAIPWYTTTPAGTTTSTTDSKYTDEYDLDLSLLEL